MATTLSKLPEAEITRRLTTLREWHREGDTLAREFILPDFTAATQFIARLAPLANAMDHHPDVQLYRYKRVKVILTTHRAGGLTQNDFELAAKIDAVPPLGAGPA